MDKNSPKTRVFELDVLRFSAAVAVVFYHLTYRRVEGEVLFENIGAITQFGYLGVNLFFMISGFVILWTAEDRTPSQFLISRFSRLYPIFWVCISLTLLGLWLIDDQVFEIKRILANLTMASGYLGEEYIDNVYWTLQVELKFYFIIFMMIVFKQIKNINHWLTAWLIACIAAPYVPVLSFITIYPHGPLFIAGATLYLIWKNTLTPLRTITLLVCLILSIDKTMNTTPGYIIGASSLETYVSAFIVFCFYVLLLAIVLGHIRIGEKPYLFKLAMMTYPLYLIHSKFGKVIFDALNTNKYISIMIVLGIVFSLSYVLAIYVDRPLNKLANKKLHALHKKVTN